MKKRPLSGWNYIVYTLIKNNFKHEIFTLSELYEFEKYFQSVYPENFHIKDKLRQILQNLRNKKLLSFIDKGVYKLILDKNEDSIPSENGNKEEIVYLLSNQAIPEWIKIGRTNSINRRLKELYNTSVPLPFDLVEYILVASTSQSIELEKNIHSILDTINPDLRKSTDAYKREFFKMSIDDGKKLFNLVSRIMALQSNKLSSNASSIS